MAHEFDTGFTVRQPSWHGLENAVLAENPDNAAAALSIALPRRDGLPGWWEPVKIPIFAQQVERDADGDPIEGAEPSYHRVAGQSLVVRDDDHSVNFGTAADSYELISNSTTFELAEAILGAASTVRYETAGSLKDGRLIYALLRLDEPVSVSGDPQGRAYPYVAVMNSHDGSAALKAILTTIRIVCWNTWQAAEREGETFTFRHTAKVHERIEEAKGVLEALRDGSHRYAEFMERTLGIPFGDREVDRFLAEVFLPMPPEGAISDRVKENVEKARADFKSILDSPTIPDQVRGTAYATIQASGEFLDHLRGYRSQDTYFGRTLLRKEPLKAKATKAVLEIAGAAS